MSTYRVIYEQAADGNWSASAADLPVFSAGATREEAEREIQQAIGIYLDEMAEQDLPATAGAVSGTVTV
ncbi:MAG TPA: type II toxin-antitoxin system HicB family antitoxin [Solirubrobacteraceae bacterium]|jgi:predicted RNase H-like HicB family nuclease